MSKKRLVLATVSLLGAVAISAQARGGPPAGAPSSARPSGGMSSNHVSMAGAANTNGPNSADRDKGQQRSTDRMSQQGLTHEKATTAHSKKKQHAHAPVRRAHTKNG